MKVKYLLIIFLLIQNIFGQAEYKLLDAFASGSTTDTFISAEFFNYSDNGSEQIAYYFTNKNEWHVLVRDTAGNNYAKLSGQIDTGRTVQKMKLFNYKGTKYLALLSKTKYSGNGYRVNWGLYIINVVSSQIVDSLEVNPRHYSDYILQYNELHVDCLVILEKKIRAEAYGNLKSQKR